MQWKMWLQPPTVGVAIGFFLAWAWAQLIVGSFSAFLPAFQYCGPLGIACGLIFSYVMWVGSGDRHPIHEHLGGGLAGLASGAFFGLGFTCIIGLVAGGYSPDVKERLGGNIPEYVTDPDYIRTVVWWLGPFFVPAGAFIGTLAGLFKPELVGTDRKRRH